MSIREVNTTDSMAMRHRWHGVDGATRGWLTPNALTRHEAPLVPLAMQKTTTNRLRHIPICVTRPTRATRRTKNVPSNEAKPRPQRAAG